MDNMRGCTPRMLRGARRPPAVVESRGRLVLRRGTGRKVSLWGQGGAGVSPCRLRGPGSFGQRWQDGGKQRITGSRSKKLEATAGHTWPAPISGRGFSSRTKEERDSILERGLVAQGPETGVKILSIMIRLMMAAVVTVR